MGLFHTHCHRSKLDGTEHVVKGSIRNREDVLIRVHSECLTGAVVYLRGHEGRGIDLGHKFQAYNLQDQGHDTVQANIELGLVVDAREYGIGAQLPRDIGVRTMRLMTNKKYLETKRTKMGHVYGSDIQGSSTGFINLNVNKQGLEDSPE
ncbi:hypothetical protein M0R45_017040 [Rubus argutus]|uniref:GTP cyclohydrolase II domain-containing protein n=1 Tax=Rubus argutus TaxID=59490 RepID=A0AAW1XVU1_RUBAR